MATIEIIIRDEAGNILDEGNQRLYQLNLGGASFHEIEGAVETFKTGALPDIEAELLKAVQKKFIAEKKRT